MSGLFVQKHVETVRAQGVDVRVIFSQGWRDLLAQWRSLRREWGLPDVVQLNVIQKQGALALWLKRRYGIPYVIIEHWSGYLPESGMYMHQSATKRRFAERVCANAETVLSVSDMLQQAMKRCGLTAKRWGRIHNVVDDFFYQPSTINRQPSDRRTLLHVSCFDEKAKNIKALLHAAKIYAQHHTGWQLVLIGTGIDFAEIHDYADALGLLQNGIVQFTGELTPQQVAEWMRKADALVLTSHYETYGVVLAEAAAAGLPILSTPVGIAEEIITSSTGIIVSQENANRAKRLSEYMNRILTMPKYPSQAQDFRAEEIGKELMNIYDSCLHRNI